MRRARIAARTTFTGLLIGSAAVILWAQSPPGPPEESLEPVVAPTPGFPVRIPAAHLPNVVQFAPQVYSGGVPGGAAGFRELQELGVRTVICVDGATPDVETAERFGLQYVHLPHGYDGVPEETAAALTKAVRTLPGPIYIHCHHGRHRSAAASAVACVGAGILENEEALAGMKMAGTSKNYRGLWQSARQMDPLSAERLAEIPSEFPEVAEIPPLAEAMVQVSQTFHRIKTIRQAAWQTPANHPDLVPAHEALLLREHFTELLRSPRGKQHPPAFRKFLKRAEMASGDLERALRQRPPSTAGAEAAFQKIMTNCNDCHAQYRNDPLSQLGGGER